MADIASYLPSIPGKWVKHFARIGLTAKGILYCLLGILAFRAAFELGSATQAVGRKGVLSFIEELVIGRVLLGLQATGLACYSIWRLLQAAKDTEKKGTDFRGIVYRLRYAASAASYGMLSLLAAELVFDTDGDNGARSLQRTITTAMLQAPLGRWLVVGAALLIVLNGAYSIYQGLSGSYQQKIKGAGLKHKAEKAMIKAGKAGHVARGIVWIIGGYLFLRAALDAGTAGTRNAFRFLENSFYGSYLLGAVAIGLICYGLFVFMQARFQVNGR